MKGNFPIRYLLALALMVLIVGLGYMAYDNAAGLITDSTSDTRDNIKDGADEVSCTSQCYQKYSSQSRIDSCLARCPS